MLLQWEIHKNKSRAIACQLREKFLLVVQSSSLQNLAVYNALFVELGNVYSLFESF